MALVFVLGRGTLRSHVSLLLSDGPQLTATAFSLKYRLARELQTSQSGLFQSVFIPPANMHKHVHKQSGARREHTGHVSSVAS